MNISHHKNNLSHWRDAILIILILSFLAYLCNGQKIDMLWKLLSILCFTICISGYIIYLKIDRNKYFLQVQDALELHQHIFHIANLGMAVVDLQGNFLAVNDYFANIHGYNTKELEGKNLSYFHTRNQLNEVYKYNNSLITKGSYEAIEIWHVHKDGSIFPMLTNAVTIKDNNNQAKYIATTAIDISYRKNIEASLEWHANMNAAIADLSQRVIEFQNIEDITDIVLTHAKKMTACELGYVGYIEPETGYFVAPTMTQGVWDNCEVENKTVVFKEFRGLWGWSLKNCKPVICNNLSSDLRSSGIPQGHMPIRNFMCAPVMIGDRLVGQVALANKKGDFSSLELTFLERIANVYSIAIKQIRYTDEMKSLNESLEARVKERTESLIENEKHLQEARQAAETANNAKSDFLTSMSHELRTPLNGILGYAQILKRNTSLSENDQAAIQTIYNSGRHLLTIINDILDISRIEAQKMELQKHPFSFYPFLSTISEMISIRAEQSGVSFESKFSNDLPQAVCADEKRLRQIILNLLGNAVKFTQQGKIVFTVEKKDAGIYFSVEDTGIGIDPDAQQNIFEAFKQFSDRQIDSDGTGLGLSISQKLVRLMGGELNVLSQPKVGSKFWFEISLDETDYTPVTESSTSADINNIIGIQGAQKTILIADNKASNREMIRDMLSINGFTLLEASSGIESIEMASQYHPDAILMDLKMPEINGLEATDRIKSMPDLKETVIIAISASVFEDNRKACIEHGCQAFLPKPVDMKALFECLETCLNIKWTYSEPDPPDDTLAHKSFNIPDANVVKQLVLYAEEGDILGVREQARGLMNDSRYYLFGKKILQMAKELQLDELDQFLDTHVKAVS
ncbi:MAG: integral membrane sensor hybrid histidine kinase [Candidatus Magnetoglobus multicellularis str. Araruama]|uniref:histidine kinase n=1 Tax=Candidatus Magnetoglobus multicellularis str. Araruama TaxID=890399 RepID=A0A1V1PBR6_9BACT|nr:MAG: integral membrane sensor hybrid histidine kinase [Candidatus Magnetoglobus multicellularis str. Araruama]